MSPAEKKYVEKLWRIITAVERWENGDEERPSQDDLDWLKEQESKECDAYPVDDGY